MDSQTLLNFLQTSADAFKDRPTAPPELPSLDQALEAQRAALAGERDAALSALEILKSQIIGSLNPLINTLKSSGYDGGAIAPFEVPEQGTALERLQALQAWVQSTRDSLYMAMDDHKRKQQAAAREQQRENDRLESEAQVAQEDTEKKERRKGSRRTIRRAVAGVFAALLIAMVGFGVYLFVNRPYFNPPPTGTLLIYTTDSEYSHQFVRADGLQSEMLLEYGSHPAWSVEGDLLYCGTVRRLNGLDLSPDCPLPPAYETASGSEFILVPSVDPAYIARVVKRPDYSYQGSRTDDTVTLYYNRQPLGSFDFPGSVLSVSWAYPLGLVVVHDSSSTNVQYTRISLRSGTRDALFAFSPEPDPYAPLFQLSPGSQYAAYRTNGQRSLVIASYAERVIFDPRIIPDTEGITSLVWSPDQRHVAYSVPDGIYILNIETNVSTRLANIGVPLLGQAGINTNSFVRSLNLYRGNSRLVGWGSDATTDTYQSVIDPMDPTQIANAFVPIGSGDAEVIAEATTELATADPTNTPTRTATATPEPTSTPLPSTSTAAPAATRTSPPTPTHTMEPTATERITCTVSTDIVINARREPSTSADPLPNGLQPGRYTTVTAQIGADNRYWYQLEENGYWVREDVVQPISDDSCSALIMRLLTPEVVAAAPTVPVNAFSGTSEARPATALSGIITFSANIDGNYEIYSLHVDGTNIRRLTNDPAGDFDPVWSPDGSQIAFSSNRDGVNQIYVMNGDGTNLRRLTYDDRRSEAPSWSPEGTQIAYSSSRPNYRNGISIIDVVSGTIRDFPPEPYSLDPLWSPDGTQIAFRSLSSDNVHFEIYVMAADGSNVRRLTPDDSSSQSATSWSPDGTQMLYQQDGESTWVMNADGSSPRLLYSNGYSAEWSPDGTQIVLYGNGNLILMNADGTNVQTIRERTSTARISWSSNSAVSVAMMNLSSPTPAHTRTPSITPTLRPLSTATRILPTSTPFPTLVPPTSTPLPPSLSVSQLPTTAITNGNAAQLSLIGSVPLPITVEIIGMSADRSVVAMAGSGRLYVYDLINLRLIELPNSQYQRGVTDTAIAISPDGRYLAYPGDFRTYEVVVYGVVEDGVVATLHGHTDMINALAFSPTGLSLASAASDETIRIWEIGTWRLTQTLTRNDLLQVRVDNVFSLAFSPDGRGLLASTYGNVDIWDIATGRIAGSIASSGRQAVSNPSTDPIMIVPNAVALVGMTGGTQIDVWNLQTLGVTGTFSVSAQSFDVNEEANLLVADSLNGFDVYSFFTTERIFTGNSGYSFPSRMYFSRSDTVLVVVKANEIQLWGIP
ncbi:MAG: hypothetical protein SF123_08705 [Chloroflexota bacterium]|nr:hypothetical protein [Chloroflexota bacterium]